MICLITGATGGIGFALARVFAQHGYGLILASSSERRLSAAKEALGREYPVEVHAYRSDLSALDSARALFDAITADGFGVDVLVNNAGFGLAGRAEKIDHARDAQLMVLNIVSVVALCKCCLPEMYRRGSGMILNVASTGAFQPGPYTASYFASKAFVLSYSKAIRYEAASKGVRVCALCPGATRTGFFEAEGLPTPRNAMPPDRVARFAYACLMRNKAVGIPGLWNRLMQLAPEPLKMRVVAGMKEGG